MQEPNTSGGGASVNNGTVNNVSRTWSTTADMLKMLKEAQEEDK